MNNTEVSPVQRFLRADFYVAFVDLNLKFNKIVLQFLRLVSSSVCRRDNKYNHCRIHTKSEGGRTKYYLIDQTCFDSIYDLIEYYKV